MGFAEISSAAAAAVPAGCQRPHGAAVDFPHDLKTAVYLLYSGTTLY